VIAARPASAILLAATVMLLMGCGRMSGRPTPGGESGQPASVLSFAQLYSQNCAGCHGAEGRDGAAIPLADPLYQALVSDETLRQTISNGQKGSRMPAFAQPAGGTLTAEEIEALVRGMRHSWSKPGVLSGQNPPAYAAQKNGDPQRGEQVYGAYCASCHGAVGQPPGKAGAVVDRSFLSLVSDQALRTIVIIGRPDLDAPDWRNNLPGHPMADQQITDLVAWLSAQRGGGETRTPSRRTLTEGGENR
jgi:cytochrome c oxidase cbb3-type subunit 3/ubiquinol-cytochrome c reductase cytochrome c subunit